MVEVPELKNMLLDLSEEGILTITINRPEVYNAMNNDSWESLYKAALFARDTPEVRVVIITGAGKAFVSGADLNALKVRTTTDVLMQTMSTTREAASIFESMNKAVIAAVNGFALGGGCEIALSCDIRIGSTKARFGLPELGVGQIPGNGGTQRLARVVGMGLAKDMILTGRMLKGEEALRANLITYMVEPEELMDKALEVAKTILTKAPTAVALAKRVVPAAMNVDITTGVMLESLAFAAIQATADKAEGVDAFLSKRDPQFPGK